MLAMAEKVLLDNVEDLGLPRPGVLVWAARALS